jgi:hypothetical protein
MHSTRTGRPPDGTRAAPGSPPPPSKAAAPSAGPTALDATPAISTIERAVTPHVLACVCAVQLAGNQAWSRVSDQASKKHRHTSPPAAVSALSVTRSRFQEAARMHTSEHCYRCADDRWWMCVCVINRTCWFHFHRPTNPRSDDGSRVGGGGNGCHGRCQQSPRFPVAQASDVSRARAGVCACHDLNAPRVLRNTKMTSVCQVRWVGKEC